MHTDKFFTANDNGEEKNEHKNVTFIPRLVVADDDCDDTDMLTEVLKEINADYLIWCFSEPNKAYKFLDALSDEEVPCLIIIDFNIPPENGLVMLKKLSGLSRFSSIPKIIYSGYLSPAQKEACMKAGAKDCLQKSVTQMDIRKDIVKMLSYCTSNPLKKAS
jgi:FixJ family two-component response regulator